ncbi:MAG: ferrous iron transport protein B [Candidatus Methanomethylophilaceae archaeon]|nr:ferrous iron transport protein B [Candidatus Methanomethylophilaceae archaeon]
MSYVIALAGNPNCGKTTLFNALTGASQRVGNWPGVTIDKKTGKIRGTDSQLVDLPGIYSMSPYSPEEMVSRNFIIDEKPDAIINIVDATNLERNLFLTLQLIEMGTPMVVALNMMDEIERFGDKIDVHGLSKRLGVPVVPISAAKKTGIDELVKKVHEVADSKIRPTPPKYEDSIETAVSEAEKALKGKVPDENLRFYAFKLLEDDSSVAEKFPGLKDGISSQIEAVEKKYDDSMDSIIADGRYDFISEFISETVERAPRDERGTLSDRIDRIVTNRWLGIPIFIAVIALVYMIAMYDGDWGTSPGAFATGWLNDWFGELGENVGSWCEENGVEPWIQGILVDGIIGGVGAVLGFLPQMIVLFVCLVLLEEIGYMARVAFVMDRVFRYFGLSGKSFIPLLVGTGCGIPGVMSTRTIESESDRRITAMTVTFMPCGAKLPVIAMIAGALFGGSALIGVFSYVLGIVAVIISGVILKKLRRFSGTPAPFIMELPPYHWPQLFSFLKTVFDRVWAFVKKAGTIILLSSILIWFLASYDIGLHMVDIGDSMLASIGGAIHAIFIPLGWGENWEFSVATITGLVAKENLIATMGTLFGLEEIGDEGEEIWDLLAAALGSAGGLSFLTFNLLCAPCFAAIGAMHRELGTWKSTGFAVAYQCVLAYLISVIVYVVAGLICGEDTGILSCVLCIINVAILIYLLWAKDPFRQLSKENERAPE